MALYFTAPVAGLAARHLYLLPLERTQTIRQISTIIGEFRDGLEDRRIPGQFPH